MTATAVSVRVFSLGLPRSDDDLVLACMTCWPNTDGGDPSWFRATWKHWERDLAEAAAAHHNAARHQGRAAA